MRWCHYPAYFSGVVVRSTHNNLLEPIQWEMQIDGAIIAIILQQIDSMLHDDGGDQAVNRVSDRYTLASQFPIDRGPQFEGRAIVGKIKQIGETLPRFTILPLLPNSLQDFRYDETAAAKVVAILYALLQSCGRIVLPAAQEIDPNGRINQDVHAARFRRIAARSPSQCTLPFRASRPCCLSLRTSS